MRTLLLLDRKDVEKIQPTNFSRLTRDAIDWFINEKPDIDIPVKFAKTDKDLVKKWVYLPKEYGLFIEIGADKGNAARHRLTTAIVRRYIKEALWKF